MQVWVQNNPLKNKRLSALESSPTSLCTAVLSTSEFDGSEERMQQRTVYVLTLDKYYDNTLPWAVHTMYIWFVIFVSWIIDFCVCGCVVAHLDTQEQTLGFWMKTNHTWILLVLNDTSVNTPRFQGCSCKVACVKKYIKEFLELKKPFVWRREKSQDKFRHVEGLFNKRAVCHQLSWNVKFKKYPVMQLHFGRTLCTFSFVHKWCFYVLYMSYNTTQHNSGSLN